MATAKQPPHGRRRLVWRWVLAGPVAVIVALLTLMGMPLYIPPGAGKIDNLVLPLVLLPLIWGILFFHAVLDRSLIRVGVVAGLVAAINLIFVGIQFLSA